MMMISAPTENGRTVTPMADITYCFNGNCPFTDCERHITNAPKCEPLSFAWLDATCRRYMAWLVEGGDTDG